MTAGVVGVLAEALAQHRVDLTWSRWLNIEGVEESGIEIIRCTCVCGDEMDLAEHERHQASVVAALPNIAVVPLETGEFFEWADGTQTQVWDGPLQTVQTWPEANEIILRDEFEHSVSVADVARQGAIFIAAARAAGGQA